MRIAILALVAMIATIGYGSAYWGGYYPSDYNYGLDYSTFTTYAPGTWHDNQYGASVTGYPVYDRWGYQYGNAYMDLNMANGYWGYNDWTDTWWQGYPGWPYY